VEDLPWTRRNRSFYYAGAPDPVPPPLDPATTAFLVIDIQNVYLDRLEREFLDDAGRAAWDAWTPFHERMHHLVIPKVQQLLVRFRATGVPCLFARIACLTPEGRDRSLSQKMPGWNNLLLPHREHASQ
jgi:biuret amidohydrolase